jgi:hypothetical protein
MTAWEKVKNIVSAIALTILTAGLTLASIWTSPFPLGISFGIGFIFAKEVDLRTTRVFKEMAWKWVVPTVCLAVCLNFPAYWPLQSVLLGLSLGSQFSLRSRGL